MLTFLSRRRRRPSIRIMIIMIVVVVVVGRQRKILVSFAFRKKAAKTIAQRATTTTMYKVRANVASYNFMFCVFVVCVLPHTSTSNDVCTSEATKRTWTFRASNWFGCQDEMSCFQIMITCARAQDAKMIATWWRLKRAIKRTRKSKIMRAHSRQVVCLECVSFAIQMQTDITHKSPYWISECQRDNLVT